MWPSTVHAFVSHTLLPEFVAGFVPPPVNFLEILHYYAVQVLQGLVKDIRQLPQQLRCFSVRDAWGPRLVAYLK